MDPSIKAKHLAINIKFKPLLKDDGRTIPKLDSSNNIAVLLSICAQSGAVYGLTSTPYNIHNQAFQSIQFQTYALKPASSNETFEPEL
jgi:hypothetical protein